MSALMLRRIGSQQVHIYSLIAWSNIISSDYSQRLRLGLAQYFEALAEAQHKQPHAHPNPVHYQEKQNIQLALHAIVWCRHPEYSKISWLLIRALIHSQWFQVPANNSSIALFPGSDTFPHPTVWRTCQWILVDKRQLHIEWLVLIDSKSWRLSSVLRSLMPIPSMIFWWFLVDMQNYVSSHEMCWHTSNAWKPGIEDPRSLTQSFSGQHNQYHMPSESMEEVLW